MKSFFYFTILLLMISCSGLVNSDTIKKDLEDMPVTAKSNGTNWYAESARAIIKDGNEEKVHIRFRSDGLQRILGFTNIPFRTDTITIFEKDRPGIIQNNPVAYFGCVDYDVVYCSYSFDEKYNNSLLIIDEINTESGLVSGTFRVGFELESNSSAGSLDEITEFTEGCFIAKLEE